MEESEGRCSWPTCKQGCRAGGSKRGFRAAPSSHPGQARQARPCPCSSRPSGAGSPAGSVAASHGQPHVVEHPSQIQHAFELLVQEDMVKKSAAAHLLAGQATWRSAGVGEEDTSCAEPPLLLTSAASSFEGEFFIQSSASSWDQACWSWLFYQPLPAHTPHTERSTSSRARAHYPPTTTGRASIAGAIPCSHVSVIPFIEMASAVSASLGSLRGSGVQATKTTTAAPSAARLVVARASSSNNAVKPVRKAMPGKSYHSLG